MVSYSLSKRLNLYDTEEQLSLLANCVYNVLKISSEHC